MNAGCRETREHATTSAGQRGMQGNERAETHENAPERTRTGDAGNERGTSGEGECAQSTKRRVDALERGCVHIPRRRARPASESGPTLCAALAPHAQASARARAFRARCALREYATTGGRTYCPSAAAARTPSRLSFSASARTQGKGEKEREREREQERERVKGGRKDGGRARRR